MTPVTRTSPWSFLPLLLVFLVMAFGSDVPADSTIPSEQAMAAVDRMKADYARVAQYQTEMEVTEYRDGKVTEKRRFLYTFRKPDRIRVDMESPYHGMVLIYPDRDGKVFVKPAGWMKFMKLHLAPDSALLKSRTGQRLDQTDLGLLIANIARSLTDWRRGEIKVSREDDRLQIEVLARDHFHGDVLTLYRFAIDTTSWLPAAVEEFTPNGIPKRKVLFRDLRTSVAVPEDFFQADGG